MSTICNRTDRLLADRYVAATSAGATATSLHPAARAHNHAVPLSSLLNRAFAPTLNCTKAATATGHGNYDWISSKDEPIGPATHSDRSTKSQRSGCSSSPNHRCTATDA